MSVKSDLQAALANYAKILSHLTQNAAGVAGVGKPTYSLDGRMVSWTEYQRFILTQMKELRRQIQEDDAPIEIRSQGIT